MRILAIALLLISNLVLSKVDVHQFSTPEREALYREMVENLRCLVCQGQNLAGSGSDWAKDVRDVVYEQISADKSKAEIVEYMVSRFGDSVLYDPPFKNTTLILWIGPFVILLGGLFILIRVVIGRENADIVVMSDEQKSHAAKLLQRDK